MTSMRQSDAIIRRFMKKHFMNSGDFELKIEKHEDSDVLDCMFRIARSDNPAVNMNVLDQTTGRGMLSGRTPYTALSGMVSDTFSREEIAMMFTTEIASNEVRNRLTDIVSVDIEYDLRRANIDYKIDTILTKKFNMFSDRIEFIIFFIGKEGDFKKMELSLPKFNIWGDTPDSDKYRRYYWDYLSEKMYELFPELKELDMS